MERFIITLFAHGRFLYLGTRRLKNDIDHLAVCIHNIEAKGESLCAFGALRFNKTAWGWCRFAFDGNVVAGQVVYRKRPYDVLARLDGSEPIKIGGEHALWWDAFAKGGWDPLQLHIYRGEHISDHDGTETTAAHVARIAQEYERRERERREIAIF